MEEIKEKLQNEICMLKEFIMKEFKDLSAQSEKKITNTSAARTSADDSEANKDAMMAADYHDDNNDTENQTGPELPLPVPNLF